MTDSERNANGQFAKGHTGNPNGRPPKVVPRHRLPHINRRTVFEVAEMPVPMRSKDGKDLGADVDLVGPGAAYERWKRTPDYQEWLKDTGQVKK